MSPKSSHHISLPERPYDETHVSLEKKVRDSGLFSPGSEMDEVVENEIIGWAESEWMIVTRQARERANELGASKRELKLVMHELRQRHKEMWGPYGDKRLGDKDDD